MGLLLLIPGLVFLLNGTEWFSAENKVGVILAVIGAILLVLQLASFVIAAAAVTNGAKRASRSFDRW